MHQPLAIGRRLQFGQQHPPNAWPVVIRGAEWRLGKRNKMKSRRAGRLEFGFNITFVRRISHVLIRQTHVYKHQK